MKLRIEEIRLLEQRIPQLKKSLSQLAKHSPACQELLSVPGIGLLTSTAMVLPRWSRPLPERSVIAGMHVKDLAGRSGTRLSPVMTGAP